MKYRIKFRYLKYQRGDALISIFIIVVISNSYLTYYSGLPEIDTFGKFGALYRGDFYLGVLIPSLINPAILLAFYTILVMQFLILSKKSK